MTMTMHGSMTVNPAGVARQLNLWVEHANIGILTQQDVVERIRLTLPDVPLELAVQMVETNGVFIDEPSGQIGLYPGGCDKCDEFPMQHPSNGNSISSANKPE